jgi:copper homeostasis protein
MQRALLLEISVESVEAAMAAERGGADRIELCAEAALGGVTPSRELMETTRARVKIPIFAMIRPRAGNFVYSAEEFGTMKRELTAAREAGMNGFVLGLLRKDGRVDVERTKELVEHAAPLPVTFHRAIDEAAQYGEAVGEIIATGAKRILTSGGKATALQGADSIREAIAEAGERIVIVPGARINPDNVREVARRTGAKELHSGLSSVLGHGAEVGRFETEVSRLRENLRAFEME